MSIADVMSADEEPTSADTGDDKDELRIGLVLNGGVSLAIWMGGVVAEIDRLRRNVGAYGELLDLTSSLVRVDVISGASAGGLNGALLALAMARGGEVSSVRDVWMQEGAIEDLLRDPRDKRPPSLLRGDAFFLTGIAAALERVAAQASGQDEASPIRLSITTTITQGEPRGYDDYFGEPVPDIDNKGLLSFQRGEGVNETGEYVERDDFEEEKAGEVDVAIRRLALAGRSTASFPGAFEPSFCPVKPSASWKLDDYHPDLGPRANFSTSRWAIDGGVLVNTPFRPALDAIRTLPADRAVRRVLAYVVPNPGDVEAVPTADPATPPSLGVVLRDALSALPRVQSIGRELEEISENNRQVKRRNYTRDALLSALDAPGLVSAADALLNAYIEVRRNGAADDIRSALLHRRSTKLEQAEALAVAELPKGDVPFLPGEEKLATWQQDTLKPWAWGLAPIEHAANTALDLIGRAMREPAFKDLRAGLGPQRGALHEALAELRQLQRKTTDDWVGRVSVALPSKQEATTDTQPEAMADTHQMEKTLQERIDELASKVAGIFITVRAMLPATANRAEAKLIVGMLKTLAPAGGEGDMTTRCLRQLIALDIVQRAGGTDLGGIDQQIRLVMCSANAGNSFDGRNTPQDKLAGLQVNHFGSFYKASWRANDWLWGRLDGADRLARLVVDPTRLRQLVEEGLTVQELEKAVKRLATGSTPAPKPARASEEAAAGEPQQAPAVPNGPTVDSPDEIQTYLTDRYLEEEDAIRNELKKLLPTKPESPEPLKPNDLQRTYQAVRTRLQLGILLEELPLLAAAARFDVETNRTAPDAFGAHWVAEHDLSSPSPQKVVNAFTACRIGEEKIADEFGSDQFTRVSTKAAAVFSSVAPQLAPGWRPIRTLANGVRGAALALHYLGKGVLTDSRTSRFLVALVLALGGALLALAVFGTGAPAVFTAFGAVLIVAAVILATLRKAFVAAIFVVALMIVSIAGAYAFTHYHAPGWLNRLAPAIAVVVVALLAILLGSLPLRRATPQVPGSREPRPAYEAPLARLADRARHQRVEPEQAERELEDILELAKAASQSANAARPRR